MAYSASLQSFLPPSAHAATSSSQHRPNRARPFQCAAVSAPSAAAASPSASAVPAGAAGGAALQRESGYWVPHKLTKLPMEQIDADKLTKEDVDVRLKWLGLFHRRKQ